MKINSKLRFAPYIPGSRKKNRGSATVELAIVAPIFMLMLFSVIEWGIAINTMSTMSLISRDAGRFAAVHSRENTFDSNAVGDGGTENAASLKNFIKTEVAGTPINWNDLKNNIVVGSLGTNGAGVTSVTANTYSDRSPGSTVTVQISYDISKKVWSTGIVPGLSTFHTNLYVKRSSFIIEK